MGEMTDLMLQGVTCQECGEFMTNDDGPGHPQTCDNCISENKSPFDRVTWSHFEHKALQAGLKVKECTQHHWQLINGPRVVNCYFNGRKGPTICVKKANGRWSVFRGEHATVNHAITLAKKHVSDETQKKAPMLAATTADLKIIKEELQEEIVFWASRACRERTSLAFWVRLEIAIVVLALAFFAVYNLFT